MTKYPYPVLAGDVGHRAREYLREIVRNFPFNFCFDCTFRSIGVSGCIVCNGKFLFETSLVTPAETPIPMAGSRTINTTINQ